MKTVAYKNVCSSPLYRLIVASLFVFIAIVGTGCEAITNPAGVVKDMMPPSPGEVAREVFDLYDADKRRRAIAYLSAAPFGGEEAYVKLYRLMVDDPDPTVRAAAVKALGLHGAPSDVPMICVRLRDVDTMVRWEAASALQKIHNPFAIKSLIDALQNDEDPDVRMNAAMAMAQYPQPEVYNTLVSALNDPSHSVVFESTKSLRLLTGQKFGNDGADWLAWSEDNTGHWFDNQQEYFWMPYKKPRGILDKVQFWKEEKVVSPQKPVGSDDASS